jgi:hypothetical protein
MPPCSQSKGPPAIICGARPRNLAWCDSCASPGHVPEKARMSRISTSADYKPDGPRHKTAFGARGKPGGEAPAGCPADWGAIDEFLQLLARAVRQFRTYPSTSPLCADAIAPCHKVLASLEGRDRLEFRIVPHELIIDDTGVGAGTIVEHELVRRLHRAHIAVFEIDRAASSRDLSRFCGEVARCDDLAKTRTKTTLVELLAEHGVNTIVLRMARRPEVLDIGAPRPPLRDLVEHERARRQSPLGAGGPVSHLYPPDKGWVRLDPASAFDTISLADLAVLVDDPNELATMLLRLTDDDPVGPEAEKAALQQKFGDVATLFSSLDPRLARVMFVKLTRAVLALEPDHRKELLRRTILPGLLDGRAAGAVLQDFPDLDLVESLCLLLDLETAAPEMLTAALNRLELPSERRQALVPLLEARLRGDDGSARASREQEPGIERYARRLIQVDAAAGKSFAEFAAFDLSIDAQAAAAIAGIRESIGATDVPGAQLLCLWSLVRLEPNPGLVEAFLRPTVGLFAVLERSDRQRDLASWAGRYRQLAETLEEPRPDISDAISRALAAFCTPDRAAVLADLYAAGAGGRADAHAVVEAFGSALAPAFLMLIDGPAGQSKARAIVPLMCDHAGRIAPGLVAQVGRCGAPATLAVAKVLGFAGPGYEPALAELVRRPDELAGREAIRALARIGTADAAAVVAAHLRAGVGWTQRAAEEAVWHFPPAQTTAILRDLLGRRAFVLQHPEIASRLLDRATQTGTSGLQPALARLAPLRFRFWSPALVRVALKARQLGGR